MAHEIVERTGGVDGLVLSACEPEAYPWRTKSNSHHEL